MLRFANGLGQLVRGTASSKLLKWEEALRIDESQSTIARIKGKYGVYVDKTSHLARLVTQQLDKVHIAVPRRFGKSSTMGMVGDLYRPGAKDLFKDTKICNNGFFDNWQPHPITTFDFSNSFDVPTLEKELQRQIKKWGKVYEVDITEETTPGRMAELLDGIKDNTGKQVVVLVDEYDIPIKEGGPACNNVLRMWYGAIKASKVLRQMLMFGTFNKYRTIGTCTNDTTDLSSDPGTLALFGFTEAEVRDVLFKVGDMDASYYEKFVRTMPGIVKDSPLNDNRDLVLKGLKEFYDGFRLSESSLQTYNPYSVLQARKFGILQRYMATNEVIPEMKDLSLRHPFITLTNPEITITRNTASIDKQELDPDHSETIKDMWNLGFLTLDRIEYPTYYLKLSNKEVIEGLQDLAKRFALSTEQRRLRFGKILGYLKEENFSMVATALQEALPKEEAKFLGSENNLKHYVRYHFAELGTNAKVEWPCVKNGRCDVRVEMGDMVLIFELKYLKKSVKSAIEQIDTKNYCEKDLDQAKPPRVFAVGVAFFDDKPAEVQIMRAIWQPQQEKKIGYQLVGTTTKN